ncbi:MAG: tRNA preQ1(34) S-adenosylmethionine ribosyltransferase-isomerase QueA [Planctomycetes bacterium]|nr:tRNA preQ1(34) S-adenosylmethionine ribosyltransferase-isomerase QueA [Planctomycetota bacterium]MCH9727239.1 tRNA preQ1(34) S-adenosylmethionine ribosyltransferase-isomerase QueA [Planctomycetota bacterium]MCH9776734.1 tRNA preQ1(34) S-adenosylmethionine ribosyltransferase-isomerase QueA [Planctomycetota bacterium]MCH9789338.1 tRNA preQ1(34) S-adenosylmethionine ribosyltransferase-isomerase QueA [Planctomycetota bacterium]MDF1743774.1 tRNA preQ1(34) S-adenosylmethionine ribosyltransferase-i
MTELNHFNYELPPELIATEPSEQRDQSRLLVLDRQSQTISHSSISDLPNFLAPGDCLVLNDTRVLSARLFGVRTATGGKWEGLYLGSNDTGQWKLMSKTRGKLVPGEIIELKPAHQRALQKRISLKLESKDTEGYWTATLQSDEDHHTLLEHFGTMPLPPYMRRELATDEDRERYQTVYANQPGAVAAPTAGLHFTPALLERCKQKGIGIAKVTLHVGIGTFKPISTETLEEHKMHSEWCELSKESAEQLNTTRKNGGRIVSVGTTSVRTLESVAREGALKAWSGETDIFIYPPYQFQVVDCLLTNFHLPKSTLLVLVSAFAGTELIRQAYEKAVEAKYRFYSYGDAMLIL